MQEEELNNDTLEENDPPRNSPGGEIPSDQTRPAENNSGSLSDDISDPTMDESSSLSKSGADNSGEEVTAEKGESEADASSENTEELSQDEIDRAFEAVNGAGDESGKTDDSPVESSRDEIEKTLNVESSKTRPHTETVYQDPSSGDDINIVKSKEFENFGKPDSTGSGQNIDMLLDVTLPISIELGRTSMPIEDILNLGPGSVVELNRLAGEPVDLLVNDKLIAKGEVVVVDENFGVRVTTMVSHEERLKSLI